MKNDIYVMQAMVDLMVGIPKFSYPAKKNAPRVQGDFAHIQLIEEYVVGLPVKTFDDNSNPDFVVYKHQSLSKLRFRIGIVDDDGINSPKIMHGWTSEAMKALMIETGYGFIKCEPISIEDAKLEKDWEDRQGFSVELYVTRTYMETIDNITSMVISGEYYEPDLIATLQIEINN